MAKHFRFVFAGILLIFLIGIAGALQNFSFVPEPANGTMPTSKQSPDTILRDYAVVNATYSRPSMMVVTESGFPKNISETNSSGAVESGSAHYNHFGTWITAPLAPQTISGTLSHGGTYREDTLLRTNLYPAIYAYIWNANNSKGANLLSPSVNISTNEAPNTYAQTAAYIEGAPITTVTIGSGDRLVVEVESYDDNTRTVAYYHGLNFGNLTTKGTFGSGIQLSNALVFLFPPVSDFTSNVTSGSSPLPVQFNDTGINYSTSWKWAYKNATTGWTQFSTSQNATYTFPAGTYDINLTSTNAVGTDDEVKTSYLVVSGVSAPVASFTLDKIFIRFPNFITATDTSTNSPTSWNWSWGDGLYSTTQNPSHQYSQRGRYSVVLNATNGGGSGISSSTTVNVFGYENYW